MIKFKISTNNYYAEDSGTVVYKDKETMGYLFCNTGNCLVLINNIKLPPGGVFKTFEQGFIDTTQWRILFIVNDFSSCGGESAELTVLNYNIDNS